MQAANFGCIYTRNKTAEERHSGHQGDDEGPKAMTKGPPPIEYPFSLSACLSPPVSDVAYLSLNKEESLFRPSMPPGLLAFWDLHLSLSFFPGSLSLVCLLVSVSLSLSLSASASAWLHVLASVSVSLCMSVSACLCVPSQAGCLPLFAVSSPRCFYICGYRVLSFFFRM